MQHTTLIVYIFTYILILLIYLYFGENKPVLPRFLPVWGWQCKNKQVTGEGQMELQSLSPQHPILCCSASVPEFWAAYLGV